MDAEACLEQRNLSQQGKMIRLITAITISTDEISTLDTDKIFALNVEVPVDV